MRKWTEKEDEMIIEFSIKHKNHIRNGFKELSLIIDRSSDAIVSRFYNKLNKFIINEETEIKAEKELKYLESYNFGIGQVGVKSGIITYYDKKTFKKLIELPFIDLSILNKCKNIGENLDLNQNDSRCVKLTFLNIESLEVLERAIILCRKELESKL